MPLQVAVIGRAGGLRGGQRGGRGGTVRRVEILQPPAIPSRRAGGGGVGAELHVPELAAHVVLPFVVQGLHCAVTGGEQQTALIIARGVAVTPRHAVAQRAAKGG